MKKKKLRRRAVLAEVYVRRYWCFWIARSINEVLFGNTIDHQVIPSLYHALETQVVWFVETNIFPEFSCN